MGVMEEDMTMTQVKRTSIGRYGQQARRPGPFGILVPFPGDEIHSDSFQHPELIEQLYEDRRNTSKR